MKILKIIIILALAITLCSIIYDYGLVEYYWYEKDGWGYSFKQSKGKSIIRNDEEYLYSHKFNKFENNPEARSIAIVSIVGVAMFLIFRVK